MTRVGEHPPPHWIYIFKIENVLQSDVPVEHNYERSKAVNINNIHFSIKIFRSMMPLPTQFYLGKLVGSNTGSQLMQNRRS